MTLTRDNSFVSNASNVSLMPVMVDYSVSQITPYIFVTAEETARQFTTVFSNGIGCVINVADELPQIIFPPQSGIESLKFPILDLPTFPANQYFDVVADRIAANTAANRRTLLYCHHGRSRSITFILAYLIKHYRLSLSDAYTLVKQRRQIALPNVGFWSQLRNYELYQQQQRMTPLPVMRSAVEPMTYGQHMLIKLSDGVQRVLGQDPYSSAFASSQALTAPAIMSFVQALKRLITTNDSSSTSGTATATNETNQAIPENPAHTNHLSTNANGSQSTISPSKSNENFKPLSQGLQKRYARGVQYNMKLVIRGECNTGKSVLWSRLQGTPFIEDYVPSDEIRVATINWSSRVCGDAIIKVEVWDVVDKSRKKRRPINPSLKLSNSIDAAVAEVSLDAEFLDVYKSTAGVLMVYDITKPWTWDYIEREIVKVPAHIPVLVIGNQLDMGHHRKVSTDKCLSFIEHLDRGTMGSVVRYCESSLRNGFGLQYIHQFLNIPFLQLQRECLLQQLQINARDMDASIEEIDAYSRSSENDYNLFIETLANKRRTKQEALAGDVLAKAKPLEEAKRIHDEAVQAALLAEQLQQQQFTSKPLNTIVQVIKKTTETPADPIKPTLTTKQKPPVVAVQPIVQQVVPKSPIHDNSTDNSMEKQHLPSDEYSEPPPSSNPLVASTVDDFVPDDNDYETFLVDDNISPQQHLSADPFNRSTATKLSTTDDENEPAVNPMVKGFREQLDSDDEQHQQPVITNESYDYEPSSPTIEPVSNPTSLQPSPPPPPIYHQISADDLDFLDQLSSSKPKNLTNDTPTPDSQSIHSDASATKPKKKKTTTKSKKEETSSTTDTTKIKKKKKASSTKTAITPAIESTIEHNDEDDLESFLADGSGTANRVSCDACMRTNFPGRRYKCLLCENYDLCGACYDVEAESQNHKNTHPMQCILTEAAAELFYSGESTSRRTAVSLTCPHCGLSGFIPRTLLTHCVEKHSSTSVQNKNSQVVMCPICVTSPSHGNRARFVLLADHIATVHDGGGDEDVTPSSAATQSRRCENEEEDSDEDNEEEEEEPSLYDPDHRAFIEEEHRRQEAARQRLAHASSLAAARNAYTAAFSGNSNAQRRPLSRQTALRGSRAGLRGYFNHYPYGALPRTTTGFASSASLRNPHDTSNGTSNQNTASSDQYAALFVSQDPMLEFVSRLVNNQPSSSTPSITSSNSQFLFGPPIPVHVPSSTVASADFARIQQQIENNESMVQIKSTLLNAKQKRSSHAQQQSLSSQPVIITHPSGYDYQLWQQHFPAMQPTYSNPNILNGAIPHDPTAAMNSNLINSLSKNSQQSYREYDPRSLLGKILRNDHDVNKDDMNEIRPQQYQDHVSFFQSILLSTMLMNINDETSLNHL
ncbi:unnamed protein product [Adineta ricciae]|uniref:Uncharacterized protein n=2 Tax=Adineta ricciae TaxID=249248 RepID=A0A815NNX5_ADIRI|nr:unnamed protein product [Adineta ricciae]